LSVTYFTIVTAFRIARGLFQSTELVMVLRSEVFTVRFLVYTLWPVSIQT